MDYARVVYWVALSTQVHVGGRTITRLLRHFGSLEDSLTAPARELISIPGIGPQTAAAIAAVNLDAVEAEMQTFAALGIRILTWEDAGYPANLLRAPDAPPVLFVRGEISQSDSRAVAVVGTRQPSPASASLARRVGHELAARGWVIVSGLAIGIDTDAHRGALDARGRTLAVLGSGVAAIYPRQNEALASEVMASGALLSEVHPLAGVDRQALITRNRITSGLSRATIVVQSTTDGGSMNTARRSLEQRRAVFLMKGEGHESFDGAISLVPDEIDWDAFSSRLDEIRIGPASNSEPSGQQPRLF